MRNFLHHMSVAFITRNEDWLDLIIYDKLPKSDLREWTFSYNIYTNKHYAMLYRAEDNESNFNCGVILPKAMTEKLWFLVMPYIAVWRLTR